jgi:hypothetical protein
MDPYLLCRYRSHRSRSQLRGLDIGCRERVAGFDSSVIHTTDGKERRVKYIALIHNNPPAWEALSQDERDQHNRDADVFLRRLTESGELAGGAVVLAHPSNAKTVRVRNGVPAVTDGPFAEGKEHLAGYYLLECASIERATEIVTGDPSARYFAVEVRPIMHMTASDL